MGKNQEAGVRPWMKGSPGTRTLRKHLVYSHDSPGVGEGPLPTMHTWMAAGKASELAQVTVCSGVEPG